jgi:hypothetical protein
MPQLLTDQLIQSLTRLGYAVMKKHGMTKSGLGRKLGETKWLERLPFMTITRLREIERKLRSLA